MNISKLIGYLKAIEVEHGDLPVYVTNEEWKQYGKVRDLEFGYAQIRSGRMDSFISDEIRIDEEFEEFDEDEDMSQIDFSTPCVLIFP